MRATLFVFAITVSLAWGQEATRVFHLRHIEAAQDIQEFATMIRTIADQPVVTADTAQKTLTLKGTGAQIQIAEWLFTELDRQNLPEFAAKEFRVSGSDDVARIFFVPNATTMQHFQEVATAVRTISEIRRAFTLGSRRALAVRGTAGQMAATEFLVHELDQPAAATRTDSRAYQMTDSVHDGDGVVRVFYLPYTSTVQQFQEVATLVRTVGEIRRVFSYDAPRALAVRGTADQVAAADWMIHELGKPVTAEIFASPVYQMVDLGQHDEGAVRIFYVKDTPTVQAFQQVATQLRVATKIRRVYTYNASRAIALRGTSDQIAQAEQVLKDRQLAAK